MRIYCFFLSLDFDEMLNIFMVEMLKTSAVLWLIQWIIYTSLSDQKRVLFGRRKDSGGWSLVISSKMITLYF